MHPLEEQVAQAVLNVAEIISCNDSYQSSQHKLHAWHVLCASK
jgi:tellurite resistance protein